MLQTLSVINTRLTSVAGNFPSLTRLNASYNMNLTSLAGLSAPMLQRLGVSECGLTNLAGNFPSLTDLYALRNGEPTSLNGLVAPNIRKVNGKKYHSFDAYLHPWKTAAKAAAKAVVGLSVAAFCIYNRDTIHDAIIRHTVTVLLPGGNFDRAASRLHACCGELLGKYKLDQPVKQLSTFLRNLVRN